MRCPDVPASSHRGIEGLFQERLHLVRVWRLDPLPEGKGHFDHMRVIRCCHLSGLFAQLWLLACMGVRGPDPNRTDVLEAGEQILVFPIPCYRLCAILSFDRLPSSYHLWWLPVYPDSTAKRDSRFGLRGSAHCRPLAVAGPPREFSLTGPCGDSLEIAGQ
jgi:hypothetical protein